MRRPGRVEREARLPADDVLVVDGLRLPGSVHELSVSEFTRDARVVCDARLIVATDKEADAQPGVPDIIDDGERPTAR